MNIFLTGGTGFIGSYVALELVKNGHNVTSLARNRNKVPALLDINKLEVVQGDITEYKLLEKLIKDKDACILVALNYTKETGSEVLQDDTLPTVFISDMAAKLSVKHFIYTSSTSVNDNLYMGGGDDPEDNVKIVTALTKQRPATLYGATKAASENYLMAQSYLSNMRINIIRPGYTFGNPAIEGGSIQGDTRFQKIVQAAIKNKPINVIKNDGTQFIWAKDLAKLYLKILHSNVNRKTYFGLGKNFISWHDIAVEAVKRSNSSSEIQLEDKGWSEDGTYWDVSDMRYDFGLEFNAWSKIQDYIDFYIELEKSI